jgi:membrane protein
VNAGFRRLPSVLSTVKRWLVLFKDSGVRWAGDACYRLGASLAYYALFSIFPLLLLSATAIGFFLGNGDAARKKLIDIVSPSNPQFRTLLDQTLYSMQVHRTARGIGAIVGFVALLVGASGAFSELESDLDLIWRVEDKPKTSVWQTVLGVLKSKALAFGVVVGAAVALLASLAISTALATIGEVAAGHAAAAQSLWQVVELGASLFFLAGVFAAVFRVVPQTDIKWRDVLGGAFVTSLLFTALKGLLAWYLSHLGSYAAYGAVGAVLGLLTWIYVSCLILLYGAEFCRVYAERFGSLARAWSNA